MAANPAQSSCGTDTKAMSGATRSDDCGGMKTWGNLSPGREIPNFVEVVSRHGSMR
jgi:hypothetical protein